MPDLILIPPAQWEIREQGVLGLVGTEHITIHLNIHSMALYEVRYKGEIVRGGKLSDLADAKACAMMLPALLFDFGMDA